MNIVIDVGDFGHMMNWHYMMDWWGVPFLGFWLIGTWIIQLIIAFFVYKDAKKKKNNGVIWFIILILPLIGFFFLIGYLVIRSEEADTKEAMSEAQKILDERYAKGEMTRKEYFQAKEDLKKK